MHQVFQPSLSIQHGMNTYMGPGYVLFEGFAPGKCMGLNLNFENLTDIFALSGILAVYNPEDYIIKKKRRT